MQRGIGKLERVGPLTLDVVLEIVLVQFDRDSGAFLQTEVDLAVLVNADICPGALSVLAGPVDHDSFSVGRPLSGTHVVRRVDGIHQSCKTQGRRLGEEGFTQVLRRLQVFQILNEKLRRRNILFQ